MYYPSIFEFESEIQKLSNKITENDFFYLWTTTHGNEGRIALSPDEKLYIDHLEDIIDTIDSKATIYQMASCSDDYNLTLTVSD